MRYTLATIETPRGPRASIVIDDQVFDAASLTANDAHSSVMGILQDWNEADGQFASLVARGNLPDAGTPLADVKLLAPLPLPGQIWAAGANYNDHIDEMSDSEFKAINAKTISGGRPWHFVKSSHSVVGPGTVMPLPYYSKKLDWEIELAVLIGKKAYRVSAEDALEYVAGYTITNDLSARDFVAREGIDPASPFRFDWLAHKGFEGACPMGPWIVPARYIKNPHSLDLKLWVDDELMQNSSTRHMIFSIAEQIEEISARITLYPGDMLMTGTPSGVGMGRGVFLRPGQNLRLWIEDIGELRHGFSDTV